MAKNTAHHDPMTTANALAATAATLYLACTVLVGYSRPTYMMMVSGWFHGVNIGLLPASPMMGGSLIGGLVTFSIVSWISGYIFAHFYNWFASR